ncbi:MAG: hypothetical protein C5B49_02260 [Bdellovibrio sp.]|nr:MAG: hypothetical protein C5B49_02260 [Bdellovibrio sp.]
MAKIVLIAEELNSVSWAFALSLHEQRQEVLLVSAANPNFSEIPPFPVLTPFRRWRLREATRILPRILAWNPDIWHFLFTSDHFRSRPSHWVMAAVAHAIPHRTLAGSFFSNNQLKTYTDLAFLNLFDLRTFGSRTQLMRVKRRAPFWRPGLNEVLPPLEHQVTTERERLRPELEKLQVNLSPYILVPDPPPAQLNAAVLQKRGLEILLLSDRFVARSPYFYSGPLNNAELEFLLRHSQALLLAECDLSILELRRYHEWAERTETPLLVTPYQNELLPGICWNQKSGWILDQGLASLPALLDSNPRLELAKGFAGLSKHELMDSTLNELLRLYQRAFVARWS